MSNILQEADRIIHGERNKTYGSPLKNHTRTAALWTAYLGVQITAEQVCFLNILQKISRSASGVPHRDNLVDIAGFTGNIEMVEDERAAQQKLLDVATRRQATSSAPIVPLKSNRGGLHLDLSGLEERQAGSPGETLKWD